MKTEIEKLVDEIYHRQTYGKDCDKLIEKLHKLTNSDKPKNKPNKIAVDESVFYPFRVGDKIPSKSMGWIKIMSYVDGYVMARYKGCPAWAVSLPEFKKMVAQNL